MGERNVLRTRRLERRASAQEEHPLDALESLEGYIARHVAAGDENRTLRESQLTVFQDIANNFRRGELRGYVELPTGFGKTVIFTEMVEALGRKALILVPAIDLAIQTEDKFTTFAPDMSIGKVFDGKKQFGQQVTIMTYDSFRLRFDDGTVKPEDYGVLILDEAHTALGTARKKAIDNFLKDFDGKPVVGFTATPGYSEDKKIGNLLPERFHQLGVVEAVEMGALAPFSVILATTQFRLDSVPFSQGAEGSYYGQAELDKAVNIQARNQAVVDLYRQLFSGEVIMVSCVSKKHARDLALLFQEGGINAVAVTEDMDSDHTKTVYQEAKAGTVKIITGVDKPLTGVDIPNLTGLINAAPTQSIVRVKQRGGRALRLDPENPDKHATIVDIIDQDARMLPLTYADAVQAVRVLPKHSPNAASGERQRPYESRVPYYPDIYIDGLEVVTDPQIVLEVLNQRRGETAHGKRQDGQSRITELKSLGYKSILELRPLLGASDSTINRAIDGHLDKVIDVEIGPDRFVRLISPELASILEEHFIASIPDGWKNSSMIAGMLNLKNINREHLREIVTKLQQSQPDGVFCKEVRRPGKSTMYFSPEVFNQYVAERKTRPVDYRSINAIVGDFAVSRKTLAKIADDIAKRFPEDKVYLESSHGGAIDAVKYYAPEIIAELYAIAPLKGWLTASGIAPDISMDPKRKRGLLRDLTTSDHDGLLRRDVVGPEGSSTMYFSPAAGVLFRDRMKHKNSESA